MAAALVGGVGNVTQFCQRQGISRQTFYKWQRRARADGPHGLFDRSRRPLSSPWATPAEIADQIVLIRKQLADNGDYCGPASIHDRLAAEARRHARRHGRLPGEIATAGSDLPSRATIARVLSRRVWSSRRRRSDPAAPTTASRPPGRTRCGSRTGPAGT